MFLNPTSLILLEEDTFKLQPESSLAQQQANFTPASTKSLLEL